MAALNMLRRHLLLRVSIRTPISAVFNVEAPAVAGAFAPSDGWPSPSGCGAEDIVVTDMTPSVIRQVPG
jgi:hypothetical protein